MILRIVVSFLLCIYFSVCTADAQQLKKKPKYQLSDPMYQHENSVDLKELKPVVNIKFQQNVRTGGGFFVAGALLLIGNQIYQMTRKHEFDIKPELVRGLNLAGGVCIGLGGVYIASAGKFKNQ